MVSYFFTLSEKDTDNILQGVESYNQLVNNTIYQEINK